MSITEVPESERNIIVQSVVCILCSVFVYCFLTLCCSRSIRAYIHVDRPHRPRFIHWFFEREKESDGCFDFREALCFGWPPRAALCSYADASLSLCWCQLKNVGAWLISFRLFLNHNEYQPVLGIDRYDHLIMSGFRTQQKKFVRCVREAYQSTRFVEQTRIESRLLDANFPIGERASQRNSSPIKNNYVFDELGFANSFETDVQVALEVGFSFRLRVRFLELGGFSY